MKQALTIHCFAAACWAALVSALAGEGLCQNPPPLDQTVTRDDLEQTLDQWRAAFKETSRALSQFATGPEAEAEQNRQRWRDAIAEGNACAERALAQAAALVRTAETPPTDLMGLLEVGQADLYARGKYELAYDVVTARLAHDASNAELWNEALRMAIAANQFDHALSALQKVKESFSEPPPHLAQLEAELTSYQQAWEDEQKMRAAESAADDLPRVELVTSQGPVVIELFEDASPQLVAYFLWLVESGVYTNLPFHRVIDHYVVEGGDPSGTGRATFGRRVANETSTPPRRHFRGAVSLKVILDGTVGSQFVVSVVPLPELDGRSPVIGTVISGLDNIDKLTPNMTLDAGTDKPIEKAKPEYLFSARVIRKRSHEYQPQFVGEPQTPAGK